MALLSVLRQARPASKAWKASSRPISSTQSKESMAASGLAQPALTLSPESQPLLATQLNVDFLSARPLQDLARSMMLLKLCSYETFVKNADRFYSVSRKILRDWITHKFVEKSFYKQFVAGNNFQALAAASAQLAAGGVQTMLCPPMEDLADNADVNTKLKQRIDNTGKFKDFLNYADELNQIDTAQRVASVMQVKLSGIFSIHSMNELSSGMRRKRIPIGPIAEQFAEVLNGSTFALKAEQINVCSDKVLEDLTLSLRCLTEVLKRAKTLGIPLLIDAELRAAHEAMHAIGQAASFVYNGGTTPLIFNTYQCYLKDTLPFLEETMQLCQQKNVAFGAKLVRGAYMTTERAAAKDAGAADLVWQTYDETSANYNNAVALMLGKIKSDPKAYSVYIASHNSDSVNKAKTAIEQLGIDKSLPSFKFAQIYGMCDHISFKLASEGFNVYKSVPFGRVDEWIPYMVRRASENHTAFRTTRNEIPIYKSEIKKRLFGFA